MTSEEIRKYNEARQILRELGHDLTGAARSDVLAWIDAEGYEWSGYGWGPRQAAGGADRTIGTVLPGDRIEVF